MEIFDHIFPKRHLTKFYKFHQISYFNPIFVISFHSKCPKSLNLPHRGIVARSNSEQLLPPVAALGFVWLTIQKPNLLSKWLNKEFFPKITWAAQLAKNLKCKWFNFLRILELKKLRSAIPFLESFFGHVFFMPDWNKILSNYFQISHQNQIGILRIFIKKRKTNSVQLCVIRFFNCVVWLDKF